jgi:hypothetical protein
MRLLLAGIALASAGCARGSVGVPRPLGNRISATDVALGQVFSVRVLSDRRVIVGDDPNCRILLFDAKLKNPVVVADSTAATGRDYPHSGGAVRPYLADSTLFMLSPLPYVLVIDPAGRVAHRAEFGSTPLRRDILNGMQAKDGSFAIELPPRRTTRDTLPTVDTFVVVRGNLNSAHRDTVGTFRRERFPMNRSLAEGTSQMTPMLWSEAMAMLSDGTIAIVRINDYHIDWVDPDGRRRSTGPVPHEWHVLTPEEKVAEIGHTEEVAKTFGVGLTTSVEDGILTSQAVSKSSSVVVRGAAQLPDTVPPFARGNAVLGDADGYLWVRQMATKVPFDGDPTGDVYDVIDRNGRLRRKVKMPPHALVKAFAPGVVYVSVNEDGRQRLVALSTR